ncbi:unnamed protein product [Rotaria socialis]
MDCNKYIYHQQPRPIWNRKSKSGIADNDATWSSAYTTVLCRAYYGPYTDEYGQEWFGGWIQMKIFAQQCLNCDEYATGELDDQKC